LALVVQVVLMEQDPLVVLMVVAVVLVMMIRTVLAATAVKVLLH
jgi:hypothetical protein